MKPYEIPLLAAEDIECRVQSVTGGDGKPAGAILLVYKDARVDMRILDEVFGSANWRRTHEVVNSNLFCNIDVWDEEKKEWVRKQDVGTESNTEKEKGQASDAFKRAGFNWGIGRELYTAPFIYVSLEDGEYYASNQGGKSAYRLNSRVNFSVLEIGYNERREINLLVIHDQKGKIRYDMTKKGAAFPAPAPKATPKSDGNNTDIWPGGKAGSDKCPECKGPISQKERGYSHDKYGREMCRACQDKAAKAV